MLRLTLKTHHKYKLRYETRDIGYGIERGRVIGWWTGEIDPWGKYTIQPADGSSPLYLFADEIMSVTDVETTRSGRTRGREAPHPYTRGHQCSDC